MTNNSNKSEIAPNFVVFLEDRQKDIDPNMITVCSEFDFPADPTIYLHSKNPDGTVKTYPGCRGRVWEFYTKSQVTIGGKEKIVYVPTITIESDNGYELLVGRFISGALARDQYSIEIITRAKLIYGRHFKLFQKYFDEIFLKQNGSMEHLIIRAGLAMNISQYFEKKCVEMQENDFKRYPVDDPAIMFKARITNPISWTGHLWDIFSDICPAFGATNDTFTLVYVEGKPKSKKAKGILFNVCLGTSNAIRRSIRRVLEAGRQVVLMQAMGIFNVWREHIQAYSETIPWGTIINVVPDSVDPRNKVIISKNVYGFVEAKYPTKPFKNDLNGEVGDKIQLDKGRESVFYDLLELHMGMGSLIFTLEPWRSKIIAMMAMYPELETIIKLRVPMIYQQMVEHKIIIEQKEPIVFGQIPDQQISRIPLF
ncbi:MAG: hypothetical protein M1338_03080 [Patescibacteria group bacterium]|nr:hypothetical protein [Patescibacteria group bacterium]